MILLLLIINLFVCVTGLIGYDCGGQHMNITTVSLLGVNECELNYKDPNSTQTYVQLLQLSEYDYAEVIQCKVELSRRIQYCGMHSHVSAVNNARMEYLMDISQAKCVRMFQDGTLSMGNAGTIDGLKPNSTATRSLMLTGSVQNDGSCKGAQYSDPYGTWTDVIVDAIIRITLKSSYVPVHLSTGRIMLKSGTICTLSDGFCIDADNGYSYWKPMPTSSCNFHQYDVLYEGFATKISIKDSDSTPTIYSLTTEDITFALTKSKEQPLCGYTLLGTEHPKLFILETNRNEGFKHRETIPVNNLDIFTYVNSKFVYVEKHVRQQMTLLYRNVIQQRCELEREVLKNALSIATSQPDEFAYKLMKGPGYMAVTAGEAIHIVKCIPLDVTIRHTEKCYSELPVTARNASLFATPKSRILTKVGTIRECNYELPIVYFIEDTWVQFTPKPHIKQMPPQNLQPLTSLSWNYATPGPLAVSGIYSQADIDKLRDHIMFPAEKTALLNSMARGITGQVTLGEDISFYNLLDEASLQKIAENTANRIWNGFVVFGSATAGVFGILIVIRVIKLAVDTIIHGYALHSAYGCSLYVLGAIWSSVTHLLLYLAHGTKKPSGESEASCPPAPTTPEKHEKDDSTTISIQEPAPLIYRDLREHMKQVEKFPLTSIGNYSN